MTLINNLETMLAQGNDSAMLRFGLGSACLHEKRYTEAIDHLERCLAMDENYTAAYKLLGRAQFKLEQLDAAKKTFAIGLEKAGAAGDKQTEREIQVFLKKLAGD
ncbi:tetratricopeptide repeat protein [Porticoccus sp.]|uniref:tetratricopeptide repeat protein n=1 Tax=Porticoccus sp. TaxID=2024853 RepID=UPI003F6A476A